MKKGMVAVLTTALALSTILPLGALAEDKAEATETAAVADAEATEAEAPEAEAAEDAEVKENPTYFVQISLDHSMVSLAPLQSTVLHASVSLPKDVEAKVLWSSSDPAVARVTDEGRIYAGKTGDAVITASVGKIAVTCRVVISVDPLPYDGPVTSAVRRGFTKLDDVLPVEAAFSLSDWDGDWVTVTSYFDNEDVAAGFAEIEAELEMKEGDFVAAFADMFKTDFASVSIADGKVTFKDAEGEVVSEAAYEALEIGEGAEGAAYIFKATDEDAAYPYLMMFAPEIDETGESINHFHFLYGDDLDALKENTTWAPMMVQTATTDAQVVTGFRAFAAE